MYALAGLARALSEAGLEQETKHYWREAEQMIGSISDELSQADALVGLTRALSEAGLEQEATHYWR